MRLFAFPLTFALSTFFAINTYAASPIIFGARGGVPFNTTDTLAGSAGFSATQRFEVGPTLGARLPLGFSVEGDALFKRQTLNLGQVAGFSLASTHSDSWEFPVMLKFTAGKQPVAPVFGVGVTARHLNNFRDVPSFLFNGTSSQNTVGFVAGAGVRFKVGAVSVTPEVRYMRWGGSSFSQSLLNIFPLSQNEASFLVGVTF